MLEHRPWRPRQGLAEATRTGNRSNKGLAISPALSRQEAMVDDPRAVFSSSPPSVLKRSCRVHRSNAQPTFMPARGKRLRRIGLCSLNGRDLSKRVGSILFACRLCHACLRHFFLDAGTRSPNSFSAFFFIEHPRRFPDHGDIVQFRRAATIRGTHCHACFGRRVRSTRPK